MRRFGVFALMILTAVILQTSLLSHLTLFRVSPDLILVVVISLAVLEGPVVGAAAGFGGGVLRDFLLEGPTGLTGLSYLLVGYLVGTIRPYVQSTSVFLPVAAVALGSLLGSASFVLLSFLFGGQPDPLERVVRVVALSAAYNTLLTPFIYPLMRKITSLYPREKVYRW